MNDLILYTTEDGRSQIKLRAQELTVWLPQFEGAGKHNKAPTQTMPLHQRFTYTAKDSPWS